jgi:hypothetical protein
MSDGVGELPSTYVATRNAIHAVACYVVAPAARAATGRIGLRPHDGGIATPVLPDGTRVVVDGSRVGRDPGELVAITTLRAAAEHVGVDLSPDPGVGHDLPPFAPDATLDIDDGASRALGAWYQLGDDVLRRLGGAVPSAAFTDAQLWPEHFDLAATAILPDGRGVNIGFSPGDRFDPLPYVYVGPHDIAGLAGPFWNAPFGAALRWEDLATEGDTFEFLVDGLGALSGGAGPRSQG